MQLAEFVHLGKHGQSASWMGQFEGSWLHLHRSVVWLLYVGYEEWTTHTILSGLLNRVCLPLFEPVASHEGTQRIHIFAFVREIKTESMRWHHLSDLPAELDCLDSVSRVGDLSLEEVTGVSCGPSLEQAGCHEAVISEL